MKFLTHILAGAGFAFAPAAAQAADWWFISNSEVQYRYVDASSIVRQGGNRIAWARWELPTTSDEGVKFLMIRMRYDCAQGSLQALQLLSYGPQGNMVREQARYDEPTYAPPGSINMQQIEFVCQFNQAMAADGRINHSWRLPPGITPGQATANLSKR